MSGHLVALGDSFSCGQGVGVHVPLARTWVGRLAAALPGGRLTALAAPGARVGDVRERQLPRAARAAPDVLTVLAGLNDVWRGGAGLHRLPDDLSAVVAAGREICPIVLVGRLPDPGPLLPLPRPVRRRVERRIAAVNAVVDAAAADHCEVLVVDLATVAALAARSAWAVDRLHPSAAGHAAIASAAAGVLREAGFAAAAVPDCPAGPTPGRAAELRWLAAHGAPWLARHARRVAGPAALGLAEPYRSTSA